ncbi:MAG: acetylglutamate kinase [Planctomycetes bacterium]|nr:acetylglutamate kinase [Planctomycetota bacterium]
MIDLVRAAPHIAFHRGKTFVIKLGGEPLAQRVQRRALAQQIAAIHALGSRLVLVHGGGPQTDSVQRFLGEEPRLIGGKRVTTPLALRALCMATAGELHGQLLADLAAAGVPAAGVAGASAGLLVARKRPPVETEQGTVDFGAVGDLVAIDVGPLRALLEAGRVPVISPPAGDGLGGLLNVNADFMAAGIAAALGAAKLVLVTGAPGILTDPADPGSLVSALSLAELAALEAAGKVRGGMLAKATAIRRAIEGGVGRVHVVSGFAPAALLIELYTNHGAGTLVTAMREDAPPAPVANGELAEVAP